MNGSYCKHVLTQVHWEKNFQVIFFHDLISKNKLKTKKETKKKPKKKQPPLIILHFIRGLPFTF